MAKKVTDIKFEFKPEGTVITAYSRNDRRRKYVVGSRTCAKGKVSAADIEALVPALAPADSV